MLYICSHPLLVLCFLLCNTTLLFDRFVYHGASHWRSSPKGSLLSAQKETFVDLLVLYAVHGAYQVVRPQDNHLQVRQFQL